MDLSPQQDKQISSQSPVTTASKNPYTRSSKDAPEVLPIEYSKDRQQGPLLLPGTEDKQVVPNVDEAGIQVVPSELQDLREPGLQIRIGREEKEVIASQDHISGLQLQDGGKADDKAKRRGRSPRCIFALFIIAVSIILIVVVPTTVLKRPRGASSPISLPINTPTTTASSTSFPSATSGTHPAFSNSPQARALPGTGMTVLYPEGSSDAAWLVYQDISGGIRRVPHTTSGIWSSSQVLSIKDAFNRSSLTAISYRYPADNGTITHHLFYINTFGLLQDVVLAASDNTSSSVDSWTPGNLGSYKFKAPLVAGVGMLVVAYDDEIHFLESSNVPSLTTAGILNLFVGGIDGLVHEYKYFAQNDTWIAGFTFLGTNGYSGISADIQQSSITLRMIGDRGGGILDWYLCFIPLAIECPYSTGKTPGLWDQGAEFSIAVIANSSLSPRVGDFYYFQGPDLSIDYFHVPTPGSGDITGSSRSISGTSITGGTFSRDSSNLVIGHVFFQSSNGSIMEYGFGLYKWENFGEVPLG